VGVVIAGVIGWLSLHFSPPLVRKQLALLAIPALAIAAICAAVAAGKPGEFGRFLLFPDVALSIGAIVAVMRVRWSGRGIAVAIAVIAVTLLAGSNYLGGFIADASRTGTRAALAEQIRSAGHADAVAMFAEPAPYCLPPMNLFDRRWDLLRNEGAIANAKADWLIEPSDDPGRRLPDAYIDVSVGHRSTPISWADKPFTVGRLK
jgi:hypothetical protein